MEIEWLRRLLGQKNMCHRKYALRPGNLPLRGFPKNNVIRTT